MPWRLKPTLKRLLRGQLHTGAEPCDQIPLQIRGRHQAPPAVLREPWQRAAPEEAAAALRAVRAFDALEALEMEEVWAGAAAVQVDTDAQALAAQGIQA